MAHPRKLIRHEVEARLIAGATAAASRVFPSRIDPLGNKEQVPVLLVYTTEEESDDESTSPRRLTRELELIVDGMLSGTDAALVEDALDDLAEEIENVMHADPSLGDEASDSSLKGTTIGVKPEGDRKMGMLRLTYAVTYETLAHDAPVGLDDFNTVDATIKLVDNLAEGDGDLLSRNVDTMTLDDADAAFDAAWIGRDIWIQAATSPDNNGRFVIAAVPSATQVQFINTKGVAEAFTGTWQITSSNVARDEITVQP